MYSNAHHQLSHRSKHIKQERAQRSTSAIVLHDIDVDAVTNAVSIDQTNQATIPSTPPPPSPPEEKPAESNISLPTVSETPKVSTSPPPIPSEEGNIDLPLPAIGVGLLAAFAAATFAMRGSVNEREEASTAASSPSTVVSPDDVSIPYDAAARLAYEQSNKSLDYNAFQKKYEADAIADVIAKRK